MQHTNIPVNDSPATYEEFAGQISETIELGGWFDLSVPYDRVSLARRLVGQMIRLGAPVIEEFHLDHISDYEWVLEWLRASVLPNGSPTPFTFLVRKSGTHIGMMADAYLSGPYPDKSVQAWDVTVHPSPNFTDRPGAKHWSVTFTAR